MTGPDDLMQLDPVAMQALVKHYGERAQRAEGLVTFGHKLLKAVALQNGGTYDVSAAALREVTDDTPVVYDEQADGTMRILLPGSQRPQS